MPPSSSDDAPILELKIGDVVRRYRIRPRSELTAQERQSAQALLYRLKDKAAAALSRPVFDAEVFFELKADADQLVRLFVPGIEDHVLGQISASDCLRVYNAVADAYVRPS